MKRPSWYLRGRVYVFIRRYMHDHGHAPTQREIADGASVARSKVTRYLRDLEADGLIVRTTAYTRNIQLAA